MKTSINRSIVYLWGVKQNYSDVLDKLPIFRLVGNVADDLGFETYVVGGYVRDMILKRPSKDIDFVCVGSGIELARAVASALDKPNKVNVFKNFGTANIRFGDYELEFVGARKESYRSNSR